MNNIPPTRVNLIYSQQDAALVWYQVQQLGDKVNHAEEIAIAIQHFRNTNNPTRLVNIVNTMREENFTDDQINILIADVARAIYSEATA